MNRKTLKWIIVAVLAVGIIAAVSIYYYQKSKAGLYDQVNMLMKELQTDYDIDLVFYGNAKPPKYCDFKYRMVDRLTEETLKGDAGENCYHIVAVTDLFDPCEITEQELLLLKRFCEEKKYAFCYAGDELRKLMEECGFWNDYEEHEYGFSYSGYTITEEKTK